jgi:putative ABC transport system substrate-binding protein
MNRREFITLLGGAAATWPLAAHAQQPAKPVIGFLNSQSAEGYAPYVAYFREGLKSAGYDEGRTVTIEYRWAEGSDDRLPALATDLVRRQVTMIATSGGGLAALAAKAATKTIPIVFSMGGDPVAIGLVASLNRPGGNVTGLTNVAPVLAAKRLELLRALVPGAATIGVLVNPNGLAAGPQTKDLREASTALGLNLLFLNAGNAAELDEAFATFTQQHADALLLTDTPFFNAQRDRLVALAERHAIPVVYTFREFAEAGGLMSYSTSLAEAHRQLGGLAGRILKGEKPSDLPVMQPTKFELVINLRTARTLGLEIPPKLLALADAVIE